MVIKTPLGEKTGYPDRYARDVLCAVPRAASRMRLALTDALPFRGEDIWNGWELTWLESTGKPAVAVAVIRIDAASPNIVESKSLKLYLNSLAMERFDSGEDVAALIARDLSDVAGSSVGVELAPESRVTAGGIGKMPGICIDDLRTGCDTWEVDASLLKCRVGQSVREELHTHLFRSNCPVTAQPDFGSVLVRYRGAALERESLLHYLVSYRKHCDFHESCVERIFLDLKRRCNPQQLTVYGHFNRRGGLDINPFRSDFEDAADNLRLWRQ